MKKNNTILLFGILLFIVSCKSVASVISSKINLEKHTMIQGDQEVKIWIDLSIISGIVGDNYLNLDSVSAVLEDLNLEEDTSPVIRRDIIIHPIPTSDFAFFKRTDNEPFSQENSPELEKLRTLYWNNFGPGIYNENGIISGILSYSVTVYFESHTSQDRINEILSLSKATKFFRQVENGYHVEFPKSWGYKVIDVAKQIFEFQEVKSVEHKIHHIVRRN